MIFVQDDVITLNKDLKSILFSDVKSTAQLNGKNYAAEFIDFPYYTCRFHVVTSVSEILYPTKYTINYNKIGHPVNRNFQKFSLFTKNKQFHKIYTDLNIYLHSIK